jgi:hypothetical protein
MFYGLLAKLDSHFLYSWSKSHPEFQTVAVKYSSELVPSIYVFLLTILVMACMLGELKIAKQYGHFEDIM